MPAEHATSQLALPTPERSVTVRTYVRKPRKGIQFYRPPPKIGKRSNKAGFSRERGGAILTVQPAQKIRAGHLRHNSPSAVVPKRHTLFGIIFEIIVLGWICAVHYWMLHTLRGKGFDCLFTLVSIKIEHPQPLNVCSNVCIVEAPPKLPFRGSAEATIQRLRRSYFVYIRVWVC